MRSTHLSCRIEVLATLFIASLSPALTRMAQAQTDPGRWDGPYEVGVRSVHGALLPTGHVVGVSHKDTQMLWDPATKSVLQRPVTSFDVFCAGMAMTADGRLLMAGGSAVPDANAQGQPLGLKSIEVYSGNLRQWSRLADMAGGERWYPTAVTLPDARVLVWSGTHDGVTNPWVEVYDPAGNAWTVISQKSYSELYPRMHVLLSGIIFVSGGAGPLFFNPASPAWTNAPAPGVTNRGGGMNSVLLPFSSQATTQKVLVLGGGTATAPVNSAEIFGFSSTSGTGSWQAIPSLAKGRKSANAVLLPSGEILVAGGTTLPSGSPQWVNETSAEIYDPAANAWRTVASMAVGRGYHSSAALLPDGSVWFGGGEIEDASGQTVLTMLTSVETYYPWYFNAPSRPTIGSAPREARYGGSIAIGTPDTDISKVLLIRNSSSTHALNTDQRAIELSFTASGGTVTAQLPASANLAPPGYYLLFLRNSQNVPSKGTFLKLSASGTTLPSVSLTSPGDGQAFAAGSSITITANASDPDGAIAQVEFYANGTLLGSDATAPYGFAWNGASSGTYQLTAKAIDNVGEATTSSPVAITVTPGPGLDLVFLQDSGAEGLVTLEAEHFQAKVDQGGHSWTPTMAPGGYAGDGAMEATPNSGAAVNTGYSTGSPRLDFKVNFVKTGTHTVWIRGAATTWNDDTCHVGLDGAETPSGERISTWDISGGWAWSDKNMDQIVATLEVATPGVHTVNVWMREDGLKLDKVVLTASASYAPSGTGPAESPQGTPPPPASGGGGGGGGGGCGATGMEVVIALGAVWIPRRLKKPVKGGPVS